MKLWFCLCFVIIGLVCTESVGRSSKSIYKINVYAKKLGEESLVNESDPDTDNGPGFDSHLDQDKPVFHDCKTHDSVALNDSRRNTDGFIDCPPTQPIKCDADYPYRTLNGSCNNMYRPMWGASNQCFRRYQPAHYTGVGSSRKSVTGASLPPPRQLSLNINKNHHHPTTHLSFMFTIYGQTVGHDVALSSSETPRGNCCAPANANDPACMNIAVKPNDPFYSQFGITCMDFIRTAACIACNTNKRQQISGQTAAIDASIVYGANDSIADGLRANDGTGRLLSNYTKKGEFLPSANDPSDPFCPMLKKYECFVAGDLRVNQHATLTGMQTLFMREHNRIAEELKEMNPSWDDERLYQEARRITIAEVQSIVFKEYLPHLLGHYYMSRYDLYVQKGSGGTKYDPSVQIGAWNEFATAAFRLHSMVATDVGLPNYEFRQYYSNPGLLWKGKMGQMLQGVCTVPSEKFDPWFVYDVTDYLYEQPNVPYGIDLAASDIQRGRDQGMAPYVYYVYDCSHGEVDIQTFDDLVYYDIMPEDYVTLLKQNYARVQDVDLWIGLQLEYHSNGAIVGSTSVCIISRQMYHLKYGDRFYFEHVGEAGSFTTAQRTSIKQTSLSRLLCDNTHISQIQQDSMLLPSNRNPKVYCSDIPEVNLTLWKES